MDNKKESERNELHKTLWKIATDLRGSVDGWDFKQYIFGLMFYRYISENIANYINENEHKADNLDFSYENCSDDIVTDEIKNYLVDNKGFCLYPSELFCNVIKSAEKNIEELNVQLQNIFKNIETRAAGHKSYDNVKNLFADIDFSSVKLGITQLSRNEKIVKMLNAINDMNLGSYAENTIDAFGDAYEYLMGMYAGNAGKSGGEYFTPQEVSELLARIVTTGKEKINRVYDPTCGSGSLLLKCAKVIGNDKVRDGFYGQELNPTTYNLCRINMFLHDVNYNRFHVTNGDTLEDPDYFDCQKFDAIVSNPPYSATWKGKNSPVLVNDSRFTPAGALAPTGKADLAFVMHTLSMLSDSGTCAMVSFPGVMYRGGAEQKIRKYLIENNFVECVIQLPSNLFFGTPIATDILVLSKSKKDTNVQFIDASDYFVHIGNKNKLSYENIESIINVFSNKKVEDNFSAIVSSDDIAAADYNLSVSTYVETKNEKEEINITELHKELSAVLDREKVLRNQIAEAISKMGE